MLLHHLCPPIALPPSLQVGLLFHVPGGTGAAGGEGAVANSPSAIDDRVAWDAYRRKVTDAVVLASPHMQRAATMQRGPSIYFRGARLKVDFTTGSMHPAEA